MMGEPTPQERKLIERRIRAVSSFKQATGGDSLPEWLDLDELAPGTASVGTGVPDKHLATYDRHNRDKWTEKRRARKIGLWDAKTFEKRLRTLAAYKASRNGIIGLGVTRTARVVVKYDGMNQGYYGTFREAAAAYDALARKYEGDRAITNDQDAVRREDKRLDVLRRMRTEGSGKTARFAGGTS